MLTSFQIPNFGSMFGDRCARLMLFSSYSLRREAIRLGVIGVMTCAAASSVYAMPIQLVVGGVTLAGELVGLTNTLVGIFGDGAKKDNFNDTPLYSTDTASPSITITATDTTFDFLLKQPLAVTEFEDDFAAQIKGTAQFFDGSGFVDAWTYDLTFTFEACGGFENCQLDADGVVKHVRKPKGNEHAKDGNEGGPLDVDASVSFPFSHVKKDFTGNGELDKALHPLDHTDKLIENRLLATCCETFFGGIQKWEFELKARHIPEPSSILLLGVAMFGFLMARLR
ncbi:MAG: PEP-CTERM sorting domain-containing protein [Alphaproteobacteria bacterium]